MDQLLGVGSESRTDCAGAEKDVGQQRILVLRSVDPSDVSDAAVDAFDPDRVFERDGQAEQRPCRDASRHLGVELGRPLQSGVEQDLRQAVCLPRKESATLSARFRRTHELMSDGCAFAERLGDLPYRPSTVQDGSSQGRRVCAGDDVELVSAQDAAFCRHPGDVRPVRRYGIAEPPGLGDERVPLCDLGVHLGLQPRVPGHVGEDICDGPCLPRARVLRVHPHVTQVIESSIDATPSESLRGLQRQHPSAPTRPSKEQQPYSDHSHLKGDSPVSGTAHGPESER